MSFSSALNKFITVVVLVTQGVYPVMASAAQYVQLVPVPSLVVTNGQTLATTNVDVANTTLDRVTLAGTTVLMAPSSIDFGSIAAGQQTALQTVTLTNIGGGPAMVGLLSTNDQFLVTANCDGAVLPVLGSCQFNVWFAPTEVASAGIIGTVTVPLTSNGVQRSMALTLRGTATLPPVNQVALAALEGFSGLDPALTLSAQGQPRIGFGDLLQGQGQVSKTFIVRSTGTAPVAIHGVSITGSPTEFTQTNTCGALLASGAGCTVTVTFAPQGSTTGLQTGALTLQTSSMTGNSMVVSLLGTATSSAEFSLSAMNVYFGDVLVNAVASQSLLVLNTGTTPLSNPAISVTGSFLSATHTCPALLASGASCGVTLQFSPLVPFSLNGSVNVAFDSVGIQSASVYGQAKGPMLSVDAAIQSFGVLVPGSSRTLTYTVSNDGNDVAPLAVSGGSADVSASTDCGASLAPGAVCHLAYTYAPQAQGSFDTTVSVASTLNTLTLHLSGSAVGVALFSVSSLNTAFGDIAPGSVTSRSLVLTNSGTLPLDAPVLTLTGSSAFTASHDCPLQLGAGNSCTVNVTFTPVQVSAETGTLRIQTRGAPDQTVAVTGTGAAAVLVSSTAQLDFGPVSILDSSAQTLTVTNTGNLGALLSYSALPSTVTQGGTCATSLGIGASCTVSLTYAPTSTATTSGTFTISAPNTSTTVSFSGTGVAMPAFSLSASTMPMGSVAVGASSTQTLQVNNTGNVVLATPTIGVTGSSNVATAHDCPATLAVGTNCTVTLTFTPTTYGSVSSTLSVGWAGLTAQTSAVSGTGQMASLSVNTATQSFGTVAVGSSGNLTYTLTNNGNIAATLGYGTLPSTVTRSGTCSSTLGIAMACTVILTYMPTDATTTNSAITVSAVNTSVTLNFSGTGYLPPSFGLSTASVAFGNVALGTSPSLTVQVNNTGGSAISTPSISVSGTGYGAAHNCPSTLGVGANCVVTVTLTPTQVQAYSGTLSIGWSGLTTQTATLSGTGAVPATVWTAGNKVPGLSSGTWSGIVSNGSTALMYAGGSSPATQSATSSDGLNWTTRVLPFAPYPDSTIAGVSCGGVLALQQNGSPNLQISSDGVNWTATTPFGGSSGFGAGCVGTNTLVTMAFTPTPVTRYSTNGGASWTVGGVPPNLVTSKTPAFKSVNGKVFVFQGNTSHYVYTSNGTTWSEATLPAITNIHQMSLVYGNGKYVLTDPGISQTAYYYSTDGINWTTGTMPTFAAFKVGYLNGKFIATTTGTAAYTSTDGINWVSTPMSVNANSFPAMGAFAGRYVVVPSGSVNLQYTN